MNKAQLVEALTTRIGDRRTAAAAVDGLVDVIVETVGSGRSVTLTGFGVFEPRRRAARVARNPRTGETVPVPETIVPSFRPGAAFRDQIGRSAQAAAGATSAPRRAPRTGAAANGAAANGAAANGAAANGTAAPARRSRSGSARTAAAKSTGKTAASGSGTRTTRSTAAATGTGTAGASKKPAAGAAKGAAAKAAPAKRTRSKASST